MAIQTKNGKAFEYATLISLRSNLKRNQQVVVKKTPALLTAQQFYSNVSVISRRDMDLAANAAIRVLLRLEPQQIMIFIQKPERKRLFNISAIKTVSNNLLLYKKISPFGGFNYAACSQKPCHYRYDNTIE